MTRIWNRECRLRPEPRPERDEGRSRRAQPEGRKPAFGLKRLVAATIIPLLIMGLLGCALLSAMPGEEGEEDGQALAVVNGREISQADLEKEVALNRIFYFLTTGSELADLDEDKVLDQMVTDKLIWQEAVEAGLTATAEEVEAKIADFAVRRLFSVEELEAEVARAGLERDDLYRHFERTLINDRFVEEVVLRGVSPRERQKRLDSWLSELRAGAEIELDQELSTPPSRSAEVGELAPDFTLTDLNGRDVSLGHFRGRPVLVNFWATWCPPCRIEMPIIQAAYEKYKEKGLVVLAVDIGEAPEAVERFAQDLGLTFTILLDNDGRVASLYRARAIPVSFFIDGEGVIVYKHIGAMTEERLEYYLVRLLESK
ncbi:MAG: redoxin domain-containing protein [Anaerolineae bacterium]